MITREELKPKFSPESEDLNPKDTYVIEACWDENDGDYRYNTVKIHKDEMTDDMIFALVLLNSELVVDFDPYETDEFSQWFIDYIWDYEFTIVHEWGICHSPCIDMMYYGEVGERYEVKLPTLEDLFKINEIFGDDLDNNHLAEIELKKMIMWYGNKLIGK